MTIMSISRHNHEQLPLDGLDLSVPRPSRGQPVDVIGSADRPLTYNELAASDVDGPLCYSLIREMVDVEVVARFTVDGDPVSKQRPRFARKNGAVYTPGGTKTAEELVGWSFKRVCKKPPDPTSGFGVYIGFFCKSGQRRDVDNMLKLVLDGLNKIAWADDSQVTEVSAKVLRWEPDPRTEVVIYKTMISSPPSRRCTECGERFKTYPSTPAQKFCSRKCKLAKSRVHQTCAHCGKPFTVQVNQVPLGMLHCSRECRAASGHRRTTQPCAQCGTLFTLAQSVASHRSALCSKQCRVAWAIAHPTKVRNGGTCALCGGATSRREYARCGACKAAGSLARPGSP